MRIVFLSDTHMRHERIDVPDGDVLVHAGDALGHGTVRELVGFARWWKSLPHAHKIFVPGNHDWVFQRDEAYARETMEQPGSHVLITEGTTIDGVRFWGEPHQPEFCNWAFNEERGGQRLRQFWSRIPDNTDVLVTHSPPFGVLDLVLTEEVGCELLRERVEAVKPRIHAFGHIHCGYGAVVVGETRFVNASICDEDYRPANAPQVWEVSTPPHEER